MSRGAKIVAVVLAAVAASYPVAVATAWDRVWLTDSTPSRSTGTTSTGRLEHGKPMPPWGPGFHAYSILGAALGRQYVNDRVRAVLLDAFAARAYARTHVVGETGWPSGGRFRPHRSHNNGLSVDIFVPVVEHGRPAAVPTWPWTKFGYAVEFDEHGRRGDERIDFEELAALLHEIDASTTNQGLRIERVIIAPEYVPLLLATPSGARLGRLSSLLSRRPAWVRHDEHVHVDFSVQ